MNINPFSDLTVKQCQSARISRDRRFDGHFYVAVRTTGIFCRPICPATTPKEENVEYFSNQALALKAGYRPCLRCRPDSAPGSFAWKGVETTFQRAIKLIDQGELQQSNLVALSERLGISDRYLRKLFQQYLGMSPKQYAQYSQLMFAKQLLHTSTMNITDVGFASGFNSVRRFNDAFQKVLKLTPRSIRKSSELSSQYKQLTLSYRPPFNWKHLLEFYRVRAIKGIEDIGDNYYRRTFTLGDAKGWFKVENTKLNSLIVDFEISDIKQLKSLVSQIRRQFDLDADISIIEQHLKQTALKTHIASGIRIPGVWDKWEAAIRAILGQQISVKAAITQLNNFTQEIGLQKAGELFFPTPQQVAKSDLSFLKMPQRRKDTVKDFAEYMILNSDSPPSDWQSIKGIGPWTINYAKMRGQSEPDCFLDTDLVVKNTIDKLANFNKTSPSPWGSYATMNCWNSQI